ncbi:MAG: Hsp33 family molecular chaperone HslO [Vulcanimicrobiaceae bacterium]
MSDRILAATAADGSFSIAAGITTALVREIQARHRLSPTASAALGRLVTGATLLATGLKGHERLSIQITGDGPLGRLVADAQPAGPSTIGARAYAQRPQSDLPLSEAGKFDVGAAVGRGVLQVTRSFEIGRPYSGIVPLQSGEIGEDLATYLLHSEQIPSVVALGVLASPRGIVAAGGIVAQVLPSAEARTIALLEERARAMRPITSQIANGASVEELLGELSGERNLRVNREFAVRFRCTCSRERVEHALLGLGRDELRKIAADQPLTEATCEYCSERYELRRDEVLGLVERLEASR